MGLLSTVLMVASLPIGASPLPTTPSRPAVAPDQVIIGTTQEPALLNPAFDTSAISLIVDTTLFTRDVGRDLDWMAVPEGVEYLPTPANGAWRIDGDTMTLRWKLKKRAWHDGRMVTCGDYVFTHNTFSRGRGGGRSRHLTQLLSRIANVSCPQGADGLEVLVAWKERHAYANLSVIPWPVTVRLPRHVLQPLLLDPSDPGRMREMPYGREPGATVGDGPYRLVEWRRGRSLTVEAIEHHAIYGTPKIKRITWRFMPDRDALVEALVAGDIDAVSTVGITIDQALELERRAAGRIKVFYEPGLLWEHIDFNLDNPILQDVRVRRAIAHSINRTEISQQLFQGRQPMSHSYLPPKHPGHTENVRRYGYDPARARALLREAGFAPGPDGIMRNAAGLRLSLQLSTTAGNTVREQIERIIQRQLQLVGIEITVLNFPAIVFFDQILERRRFRAMAMYSWIFDTDSDCGELYMSDAIPSEQNNWLGGLNYPGYRNMEMDRVCKEIAREIDEAKRNRLLHESAQIFSLDLPALPLYFRVEIAATKVGLRNFFPLPASWYRETWNVHRWYWE